MLRGQISDNTIHNFEALTSWKMELKKHAAPIENIDGELLFRHPKTKEKLTFLVEIKNELRSNDVLNLFQLKNKYANLIVLANHIPKLTREQLRNNHINYIESSGNCYIEKDAVYIFIDNQKVLAQLQTNNNKLYTASGMRFVYAYFLNPHILNATYREIAGEAEIALGNVGAVIEALESESILKTQNHKRKINDPMTLFEIWANNFESTIRPHLFQRALSFADKSMRTNWKDITLHNTFWGGEPAANLMDNHLSPEKFVLYSPLRLKELMKEYKLIPNDLNGEILYMLPPFEKKQLPNTADPFLIYAELIVSKDSRCLEAAQRIKEKYIESKLRNI